MTRLALIRHGSTAWNESGRVQGQSDVPLSPAGRETVERWRPPPEVRAFEWVTSPLVRAAETATLLGAAAARAEPRLMEMHWGAWEGETLAALRARYGEQMVENEARGLDFRAPRGESPRALQARLRPWLAEVAAAGRPTVAVTHKGVIRAVMALATGWDMTGKPPARLDWAACHLFTLAADGAPSVACLNLPLVRS